MRKILITTILLTSTIWSGCDNKMRKAVDASARLAAQIANLQQNIESGYRTEKLPYTQALAMSKIVRDRLIPAGRAYTDFIDTLSRKYPKGVDAEGNKIPVSQWAVANALFDAVDEPFREILVMYGALTPEQSAFISLAIAAIVEIINLIREVLAHYEIPAIRNYRITEQGAVYV